MVTETIGNVTVNSDVEERKSEAKNRLKHDGSNPRQLIMQRNTKAKEPHRSKDKSQDDRNETELKIRPLRSKMTHLRFVNPIIPSRQPFTQIIVDRS